MKLSLGLDIGIASIGFAVVERDEENFTGKILDAGVRIYSAAEVPKTGASLALPRRIARGARRRLQRRSSRLYQIRKFLIANNFISEAEIENVYADKTNKKDVWDLRKEALQRKLSNEEFYRCLIHIAKRRGFKSIRKSEEAKSEGALLKAISENQAKFNEGQYKTIGEMFASIYTGDEPKRNKKDSYKNSIPRSLLFDEVGTIFEYQRNFNSEIATKTIEEGYKEIAFYQRPLKTVEHMVGKCTFEPTEKRAPKCAYTSELFTALTKLVNLSIISEMGDSRFLFESEIIKAIGLAHEYSKVTYTQLKKFLNLEETDKFNSLSYTKRDKDGNLINPESATLLELKGYQAIKKAVIKSIGKEYFETIKYDKDLFNDIATVLTYEKSDEAIVKRMNTMGIQDEIIDCTKDLSMSKTMHLSIKAMDKIIPFMQRGLKYNEACLEAGYNHSVISSNKAKQSILPALSIEELTTNPVVNRSICQTRKVVNALIRKYGKFDNIVIEMSRDLSKTVSERRDIQKAQEEFQNQKELAKKRCIENGIDPDNPKSNLLKFRLWEEQGGYCIYSGKPIDPKSLRDQNYTEIDHIIPYSKSFDDSLNNKVLCLATENQNKRNKIPYEYIGEEKWYEFTQRIKTYNLKSAKINRLTRKTYAEEGFKSRNLNDTRYMAKFIKDYIKENLDFGNNLKVETRNGSLTAFLRTQWGLVKNREENDKHHAQDAIVLACSTQGMVKYLSTISAKIENYEFINNKKPRFKKPWETFAQDVDNVIANIFVSRAQRGKISGEIHDATIRSAKHIEEGYTTLKTSLEKVNLNNLENLFDKERNLALYNVLKERLEEFNNDPKKAFEEPVYMPLSEEKIKQGQKPHKIKSVKLKTNGVSGILVHGGFANNSSMARLDVFKKKNKKEKYEYFFVPVYVSDFGKELPNKTYPLGKKPIYADETFEFCFSLYSDSLISINMTGKEEDEHFWYYKGYDINTGRFTIDNHDRSVKDNRISPKSAHSIKKYQIDVLGNYNEIKQEKRLEIKRNRHKTKGKKNGI